jgi:hypothetical protein
MTRAAADFTKELGFCIFVFTVEQGAPINLGADDIIAELFFTSGQWTGPDLDDLGDVEDVGKGNE